MAFALAFATIQMASQRHSSFFVSFGFAEAILHSFNHISCSNGNSLFIR